MTFAAFLILNAIILIRPAEIVQPLAGLPLYNVCVLACLVITLPAIIAQFAAKGLKSRPIAVCIFAMIPAIVLSKLWERRPSEIPSCLDEMGRVILYYVLLVGSVTSRSRLAALLRWVAIFIGVTAGLCLLQYHGLVDIPALDAYSEGYVDADSGEFEGNVRLQASGLFNNPNALARILTVGILCAAHAMTDPKRRHHAPFWGLWIVMLGYAEALTMSRGGFLGLLAGTAILLVSWLGVKKAAPLAGIAILAMLAAFGGRQTDLSTDEGTGKQRIELWNEGFELWKRTPLVGIGMNRYAEEMGLVAHNSFIHGYVELGFLGGSLFTGAYCLAIAILWKLGGKAFGRPEDPELLRLRPFLLAILGAEVVGGMSISRTYSVPTYLPLGMVVSYLDLVGSSPGVRLPACSRKLFGMVALASLVVLTTFLVYVKFKAGRA